MLTGEEIQVALEADYFEGPYWGAVVLDEETQIEKELH